MASTWDHVVAIATELPETVVSTSWGTPSLKVRKKLFARLRTESDGSLALRCTSDDKQALVASDDPAFFTTPHYDTYDYVLVDLAQVDPVELEELVVDAWRQVAPVRVREAFDA